MSTKREEAIALLEYMVKHNRHHAEELADIVGQLNGAENTLLQSALTSLEESNGQLEEALELAKENDKGGAR